MRASILVFINALSWGLPIMWANFSCPKQPDGFAPFND